VVGVVVVVLGVVVVVVVVLGVVEAPQRPEPRKHPRFSFRREVPLFVPISRPGFRCAECETR